MSKLYKLVKVDSNYCDFLRFYDNRVSYNANSKSLRPFVGVLFRIEEILYFAPLSSPKPKHLKMKNKLDFYKIAKGKLGAINLNNMIPVKPAMYTEIDLNKSEQDLKSRKYQFLLNDQLRWLNRQGTSLATKAATLYNNYINNKLPLNLRLRCCDFPLLEEKCLEYEIVEEVYTQLNNFPVKDELYYIYEKLNNSHKFREVVRVLDGIKATRNLDIYKLDFADIDKYLLC